MKRALITGITGQDGSYLADLLLEKGYEVHGIIRRASTFNTSRIDHLYADPHVNGVRMFLHYGDLSDSVNLVKLLYELKPDEIYHLGAQSHVRVSFDIPEYTSDVTGVGTIRILEAIREAGLRTRFLQASSSEMFGKAQQVPQNEKTPFWPRSPYGVAKVFSYWATVNYRESYGLCASNGIMFNHESPRRGETFVTSQNLACSRRDQARAAKGIVPRQSRRKTRLGIRPGVRGRHVANSCSMEKATISCWPPAKRIPCANLSKQPFHTPIWIGSEFVKHDPRYERPAEVDLLLGDASKAKKILGWEPKVRFHELVRIMVDADMELLSRETPRERLWETPVALVRKTVHPIALQMVPYLPATSNELTPDPERQR